MWGPGVSGQETVNPLPLIFPKDCNLSIDLYHHRAGTISTWDFYDKDSKYICPKIKQYRYCPTNVAAIHLYQKLIDDTNINHPESRILLKN